MDNLLGILIIALNWRTILSTGIGIVFSLVLTQYFPEFDGRYGLLIILFACGFGIFWQQRVDMGVALFVKTEGSDKPISIVGLLILSIILFSILYAFLSSILGALVSSLVFVFGVIAYQVKN